MLEVGPRRVEWAAFRGQPKVFHGASPVGALLEVMGHLRRDIIERRGEDLLQPLGAPAMQHRASRGGLALVERFAVERVRERVPLDDAAVGQLLRAREAQDVAAPGERVAALLERAEVHVGRRRADRRRERHARDRGDLQYALLGLGEALDLRPDHLPQTLRELEGDLLGGAP